jgi:50S ribosomal protein L16 3-hydroxylase
LNDPKALERALGEVMTEPKPLVWFEADDKALALDTEKGIALDRRTRMMHDEAHIYINGESYEAAGKDAALMRRLADERRLSANEVHRASRAAKALLAEWQSAGWVKSIGNPDE